MQKLNLTKETPIATSEYYHVTTSTNINSIIEHGMHTNIGENQRAVGDNESCIYLCDADSVPYWTKLLGCDRVVCVDSSLLDMSKLHGPRKYSGYKEWLYCVDIPAFAIKESDIDINLSPEKEKQLILDYISILNSTSDSAVRSFLCDTFPSDIAAREMNTISSVFSKLNLDLISKAEFLGHMKEDGNDGYVTFLDKVIIIRSDCGCFYPKNCRLVDLLSSIKGSSEFAKSAEIFSSTIRSVLTKFDCSDTVLGGMEYHIK